MIAFCILLAIACCYDYRSGRIPNALLLIMFAVGWIYSGLGDGLQGCLIYPLECVGIMALLYPLFKIGALGAGDVKLYGICVGYFSGEQFLLFLFLSLLIAAIISVIKMIKECNAVDRMAYLCEYVLDVVQSGKVRLYIKNEEERKASGICMAGPIFCSVLLHLGGVY
uniref:A24 family peptidase n=1 Tax=Acetatifactor sp. TaxID=1872090 RepID=UPI0040566F35